MESKPASSSYHRLGLILSALIVGALYRFLPYGQQILYPFTLLSTWVHEMGHGITALCLGGAFKELKIFDDASGYAISTSSSAMGQAFTAMGGLLAPPFIGMILLGLSRSFSRIALWALSGAMLISLVVWVRSLVGFVSVGALCSVLLLISIYAPEAVRRFTVQFLGITLVLFTVVRMDYLFVPSGMVDGKNQPSDISAVADVLGGPYQLWGGILATISFLFLLVGLYAAWRAKKSNRR